MCNKSLFVAHATKILFIAYMHSDSASLQVDAWAALLVFQSRLIRQVERALERHGLIPLTFYDVLLQLRQAPGRSLRFRELKGEIVLSRSALSRCVDRLAAAGLVAKDECREDPRGINVRLLPAGKAALTAAWPVYREQILSAFGRHFSDEELHFLVDRFSKLKGELELEP
jgi:DNA-binding MarR family transcriptional regulator